MPDEVENALKLLKIESVDVRFIGMYGMGGVGKTTLVKVIFNRISSSFESCCFLANIREEHRSKGVEYLRKKLLQDLNPKAATNNSNMDISNNWEDKMKKCVRMKSVLIVLDDIGERSHITELFGDSISFGSKSRIIVTTRDERTLLMNLAEASSSSGEGRLAKVFSCITKMEVKCMNPKQAMQLFSKHAFERNYPLKDYMKLSNDVISICGGLPLALEVIGSLLYGMSIEAWEDKVTNLKKIPAEDVQEKLMISYNALENDVKEIFLDIACFFIGEEKSNPFYMWDACCLGPTWGVGVLVATSLVKITDDGKFWMHDQLRDLGREIVRIKENNSPTFREGSRIQTYDDAYYVNESNKKGKKVVGLRLRGSSDKRLIDFADYQYLRYLQVTTDVTFHHSNFWRLSKNLRWLSLRLNKPNLTARITSTLSAFFRNRDTTYMMKLVVLDLSWSDITSSWEGWTLIQELRRLKVLNLGHCIELTRTPNFFKMEALEKLIFNGCMRITKIDSSIGKLRKLKNLDLFMCIRLEELPEEIGNLEDLEQININYASVSKLPNSIGKLKNVERLDFGNSDMLKKLPKFIGELRSLVHLNIIGLSRLKELPASIGLLVKLKHLNLSNCVCLTKLPDSIGNLTSLVSLNLNNCRTIVELPTSFTRLEKLEGLSLTLDGCSKLVKLPDELGNLESLVKLKLISHVHRS